MKIAKRILKDVHWSTMPTHTWVYEGELVNVPLFRDVVSFCARVIQSVIDKQVRTCQHVARHEKQEATDKEETHEEELKQREAIRMQRIDTQKQLEKPLTLKGVSHKPSKAKKSRLPTDPHKRHCEKMEKIEAALQHEHKKKEREAKTMMELQEKARLLEIGNAIQNGE